MAKLKHSLRSYFKTPIFFLEKNFICFSGNLCRKKTISMQLQLKRFVGQEKIAFFSQVILDKQNCILPPFPPAKSVYSGHSWLLFRMSRFARHSNWSHSWPENTDFLGEKWGKTEFLSSLKIFPKKIAIPLKFFNVVILSFYP